MNTTPAKKTSSAETARASEAGTSRPDRVRVGIGGWIYEPWRGTFFPEGLSQKDELAYTSRHVTAIEINSTYYGTQKPATFAKWRDDTPEGFVFSMKASRYATNRRVLSEAGESVERFVGSGIEELGPKLGPIVWEFARTKQFDESDFEGFLKLLPPTVGKQKLRHALDVRHESFKDPAFLALARKYGCATVFTDGEGLPSFADTTGAFIYARLMDAKAELETGYSAAQLDEWARHARSWSQGRRAEGLPHVEDKSALDDGKPREVFIYMINGAKERAPAAAMGLLERLGHAPPPAFTSVAKTAAKKTAAKKAASKTAKPRTSAGSGTKTASKAPGKG